MILRLVLLMQLKTHALAHALHMKFPAHVVSIEEADLDFLNFLTDSVVFFRLNFSLFLLYF
jgi:hypothetical protein